MRIHSIQTGRPETHGEPGSDDPKRRPWTSAIWKRPAAGAVRLGRLGLEGDAVADRRHHGGPDQALLAYGLGHYDRWREELGPGTGPGDFGENLTVDGALDAETCLGDRWRIGEVEVEVTQPREPCNTLARRHGRPELIARVIATASGGWYLRVLREGILEPRAAIELVARPHPAWTIPRAHRAMLERRHRLDEVAELARLPALGERWRVKLAALVVAEQG